MYRIFLDSMLTHVMGCDMIMEKVWYFVIIAGRLILHRPLFKRSINAAVMHENSVRRLIISRKKKL